MGNTETSLRFMDLQLNKTKAEVHEDWNMVPGTLECSPVTTFSAVHPSTSRKRPFMEKALQASKIYRHPGILRYLDGGIVGHEIIIITEEAMPLLTHGIGNLSLLQITTGLASIIDALIFLHDKAGVSHNNVCASSIYITSDGIWKLWGFEYLCSFGDLTKDHIEKIDQYCNEKSIPPDSKSRISPAYQHARDCFFFAKFIDQMIAPLLSTDEVMVTEFLKFIRKKALHSEWTERPRMNVFLENPLFQHKFLRLRTDIANILLLSADQRDEFIRSLPETLKCYPDRVVASTLASLLLSHSFLLIPSSASNLMPFLLTPKSSSSGCEGLFSPSVFKESIIPLVLQLFSVRDGTIRKILLAHFQHYASLISRDKLQGFILPQILLGIRDTDDELASSTLFCLAHLVSLLGADVVIGRNREQIFTSTKPKTKKMSGGKIRNVPIKKKKQTDAPGPLFTNKNCVLPKDFATSDPVGGGSAIDIPERSSPDGGETTDDDVFTLKKESHNLTKEIPESPTESNWSDWEEMLDQPLPEITGRLQVKSTEDDNISLDGQIGGTSDVPVRKTLPDSKNDREVDRKREIDGSIPSTSKALSMQLKGSKGAKVPSYQILGQEYDIMSLEIEKKPDSERDFFADIKPNLRKIEYNLENMLLEASSKTRQKCPSVSDTLAELDVSEMKEGDEWEMEGNWSPVEEFNFDETGSLR